MKESQTNTHILNKDNILSFIINILIQTMA